MSARAVGFVLAFAVGCSGELRLHDPAFRDAGGDAADAEAAIGACKTDGDCGLASLHCDVASGACVACTDDSQCTSAPLQRCEPGLHRCVECRITSDCAASDLCETSTHKCVERCSGAHACPTSAPRCDGGRGLCVRCQVDADCASGTDGRCEIASGRCVGCLTDADCGADRPRCDATIGQCVGCLSNADCAPDRLCDPSLQGCAQP